MYQCGSCEQEFHEPNSEKQCPHCGSGNWVEGHIDDPLSKLSYQINLDPKKGKVGKLTPRLASKNMPKLIDDPCECDEPKFGCYPEDGKCSCGHHKHHIHCETCGKISQYG